MKRVLIFTYGLLAYALFLFTFLYAIAFVADWDNIVPKAINTGEQGQLLPSLLINIGLLGLFAVQHTIMARPAFKQWVTRFMPRAMERSTFVIAASLVLLLLFWQWQPMTATIWVVETPVLWWLLTGISMAGWAIVLYSSFLIDHFDLFGLRQVVLYLRQIDYKPHPFMERSLYRFVRHPLMVGFLIAFWFTPHMTTGHLLFAAMTTGYIIVGVMIEERDLVRFLGDDYREYRQRTPKFIPVPSRGTSPGNETSSGDQQIPVSSQK